MNDPKIRDSFKKLYLKKVSIPCLIFDEMGIAGGSAISDLAAISSHALEGFEIKSASDTLYRLPRQIKFYNQVFNYINIITEPKYLKEVELLVPKFWGIILTKEEKNGDVTFSYQRFPVSNPFVERRKQAELIWKHEACQLLYEAGVRGISKLRREKLWDLLSEKFTSQELKVKIYETLRKRVNWKEPI